MLRHFPRIALALAACAAVTMTASPAAAERLPTTELLIPGDQVIPLKNAAMITNSKKWGLRFRAGQQDSHLTITYENGRLIFKDTGTQKWRKLGKICKKIPVSKGVGASCGIPKKFADRRMFIEVWPRLGDDYVDARTLPAKFRMWVLVDWGDDTVYTGDGDDFVNAARGVDYVWTGAGDDWARGGEDDDYFWGGSGHDKLVGGPGRDELHGEVGDDWVGGGLDADVLWADGGKDKAICGSGSDDAYVDDTDRYTNCERVVDYRTGSRIW